jgi:hypothetical protein
MKHAINLLLLLFTGLFLNNFYTVAQPPVTNDCAQASLLQMAGTWKQSKQGSVTGIAPTDLVRQKKLVDDLHAMIKLTYKPLAVEANFGGAYNRPYPNMAANSYYYRIIPLNFYCDGGSVKINHETSTFFQIGVNMFDAEIYDTAQGDRLLAEGFNVMPDMPVAKDGYWYFKETDANLGFGVTGKKLMFLITYDGKLPYSYISKRAFLEKRKQILTTQMAAEAVSFNDALKSLEIEKGLMQTTYKNDPEKLSKYLNKDYPYTKNKFEKLLEANAGNYKPEFEKIETQLSKSAAEMDEPAIVKKDPKAKLDTYIFTNDDDPFGKVLIKPNPGYFNKKIARSAPQFICVTIIWNHKEPKAANFEQAILKAVDFSALKNMLGK